MRITKHGNGHRLVWNGNEPAVIQNPLNGWNMSWNPDDGRYYMEYPDGTAAGTFKDWRNAVQFAKRKKVA